MCLARTIRAILNPQGPLLSPTLNRQQRLLVQPLSFPWIIWPFFGQDLFYFGPFLAPYGPLLASFRSQIDPPNFIWTESHQFSTISDDFMTFPILGHRPRRYLLQPLSIQSSGYRLVNRTRINFSNRFLSFSKKVNCWSCFHQFWLRTAPV